MPRSSDRESPLGLVLAGVAMMAFFGFLSWLQIERITKESYWVIFRIWFIPVPAMLLTGIGAVAGIVFFVRGIAAGLGKAFRR